MVDEKKQDPWWTATFGKDNIKSVKRDIFMEKYLAKMKSTDSYTVRILAKYVIRGFEADDGCVLHEEFYNFVQRFGPLEHSLAKAKDSLFDKDNLLLTWFHGALSREEAEKRLGEKENGLFLIRFSEKFPTKLTIMYTSTRESQFHVKNILVHNSERGFTLHDGLVGPEGSNEPPRYFSNLQLLIESFKQKLAKPVSSPILEYIKHHDQPGSKPPGYSVPDFTREGRYTPFTEGARNGTSSAVATEGKARGDVPYMHFEGPHPHSQRKPSTGGHEPGSKHGHADYTKFPGKDSKDKDSKDKDSKDKDHLK